MTTPPATVAIWNSGSKQFGNALMLVFAAVAMVLAVASAEYAFWVRALLGLGGVYLVYVFFHNRRSLATPPSVSEAGLYCFQKEDGSFLLRGQLVPWAQVSGLTFQPSGLVWVEFNLTRDGKPVSHRAALPTQTYRNGPEFRLALEDTAARHGVPVSGQPGH